MARLAAGPLEERPTTTLIAGGTGFERVLQIINDISKEEGLLELTLP